MDLEPGKKYELKEKRQLNYGGELIIQDFWFPVTYLYADYDGNRVVKFPDGQQMVLHREQELRPL